MKHKDWMETDKTAERLEHYRYWLAEYKAMQREYKARTVNVMGVPVVCKTQEEHLTGRTDRLSTR